MPMNRAILHAYDGRGEVIKRRTMDLHRYWDGSWERGKLEMRTGQRHG
jgi:hypothetical protein